METFVAFMVGAVADKDTLGGAKLEFVSIIGTEVWEAGTAKDAERGVSRVFVEEQKVWRVVAEGAGRKSVDEVSSSGKGLPPKGHR